MQKSDTVTKNLRTWGTYAAAAGAALAMSTSASAEIMYSGPLDITASITPGGVSSQITPFTVAGFNEGLSVGNAGAFLSDKPVSVSPPRLEFFAPQSNGLGVANDYAPGQMITGGDAVSVAAVLRQHTHTTNRIGGGTHVVSHSFGAFGPGTVTGFVGFKISSGALAGDLGWLEVKVSDSGSPGFPNEAEVIAWAYNNSPGTAIMAGTPEPGTTALGLLALGAMGILTLRKRRAELAAK